MQISPSHRLESWDLARKPQKAPRKVDRVLNSGKSLGMKSWYTRSYLGQAHEVAMWAVLVETSFGFSRASPAFLLFSLTPRPQIIVGRVELAPHRR